MQKQVVLRIFAGLGAITLLFMGCSEKRNQNALLGSYNRGSSSIEIYENDEGLFLQLDKGESFLINVDKNDKIRCDAGEGSFSLAQDGFYKMVYFNNAVYTRFEYNAVDVQLKSGIDPNDLIGQAFDEKMPKSLTTGKREPFEEIKSEGESLIIDLVLANSGNRFQYAFYEQNRAFLCSSPAAALKSVQSEFNEIGIGLVIKDAYRPWFVSWLIWNSIENPRESGFVNPEKASDYNRGSTVDVVLYSQAEQKEIDLVSCYGELSYRSSPEYLGGNALQREYRQLLVQIMNRNGFQQDEKLWWRFVYKDSSERAVRNESFRELSFQENK